MPRRDMPTSPRRMVAIDLKKQVFELRILGHRVTDIAKRLRVSKQRVSKILAETLAEYRADLADKTGVLREIELVRLEKMMEVAIPRATGCANAGEPPTAEPDPVWLDKVVKVSERISKLTGLDAQHANVTPEVFISNELERADEILKRAFGLDAKVEVEAEKPTSH